MNETAAHFSSTVTSEQVLNGVKSGFDPIQAFDLLSEAASQWTEHDRLDVLLLRAICDLSVEQPEQIGDGFTPWDIVEAVSKLRGRPWSSGSSKDQMSDDVRRQWKKLELLWDSKIEGIREGVIDQGIQRFPQLERVEGGGTGNPTRYKVVWVADTAVIDHYRATTFQKVSPNTSIRYICEDIQDAGPLARLFTKGYQMVGWRKYLYLTTIFVPLFICYIAFVLFVFKLSMKSALGTIAISSITSFAITCLVTWYTLNPLYDVPIKKITVAPWWMQSVDDDRLIELRIAPENRTKSLKAVRYSSNCPICKGKVYAKSGGWEFRGRVVGRCEENPVEHVFSFDHITRIGKSLRG